MKDIFNKVQDYFQDENNRMKLANGLRKLADFIHKS